jgi:hypothetical protein
MMTRVMVLCVVATLAAVSETAAQKICPPEGGEEAVFLLTSLAAGKVNAARAAKAGLPEFAPEQDARVLRDESDAEVCIGLLKWAKSLVGWTGPRRRWAFYAAGDRYIVISWREAAEAREGFIQLGGRRPYIAILDTHLELLSMSPR